MKKQRLSADITIGGVLEKSFKKNIGLIRSGFESVGDSIKSVRARQKELSRQRADLIKQGKSVEALDREYEDLERTLEQLIAKQKRWERAMRDSRRVGESFSKMTDNIGRLSRRMALGVAAAGAGVFTLASSTAEYGDNVAKTAGKLGIGIEALQEYRYAAERSGVSVSTFDSSVTAMQKRLGEAVKGTGAAKKALDQIGLSANDLVRMGPEKALGAISDKLNQIENPAERAALAAALFSRSGIGMVNMLGSGSKALEQLRMDARRTGYVLSEQAARDAEKFADAQLDAQLTIKGLKNTIGAELMPVVSRSMKQFSAWAVANREDIVQFADTAATKLEAALPVIGQVAEGMGKVSRQVGAVISKVAEMVGGWENFGILVGTVLAGKTLASVVSFGVAVGRLGLSMARLTAATPLVVGGIKAIGAALLMNPIGLTVAAIAGSAALIYKNWDKVGPWFGELWGGVQETFEGFTGFVGGVWRGDWKAAAAGARKAWGGIKGYFSTLWDGVGAVFRGTWENVIKPVTDALGWTDGIISAWESVKTGLQTVLDWLGQKFDWLMGKLQPVLDGLTWLRDKGTGAVEGIKGIGSSIGDFFSGEEDPGQSGSAPANPRSGRARPRHISGSFLGGDIGRGFRRVGEQGPETIWNSKGAYVAHAGATERLARMASRAEPLLAALGGGLQRAMEKAQAAAPLAQQGMQVIERVAPAAPAALAQASAAQSSPVVQNITFHAMHLTVAQIADELERRKRMAQAGALYDVPHDYGQYGGE
ncbi:phage tail length tape measure protein [Leisingera sp. ANG-Vp]|uniref:phage tail length tape measure protein n=1 Tax=Leisingera sp. ANG-Vp TaxID=1577896 RepID=UPI00057DC30E|nr:phage tail length tape measure protein [Leisingera sp. ANG-Vp]KIC14068.1 phage tail length tape measure protein [Leisingera sp. ANG-Vp]